MAVEALDHVNIGTDRVAETREFFMDVIGLTYGVQPSATSRGCWLYAGDRAIVHLSEKSGPRASTKDNAVDHFALAVTDIEAVADKLRSRGVTFTENVVPAFSLRQIVVTDPNGIKIELNCRTPQQA
jgi:catechol 2,3-dioxygenase-like lactoylglutathione lyase family enzyme